MSGLACCAARSLTFAVLFVSGTGRSRSRTSSDYTARVSESRTHGTSAPEPFRLRDGRELIIRRIRPDDAGRLVSFHRTLSARTRRFRFFSPMKELAPDFATRLANVDFVSRAAFLGVFPENDQFAAVGRYEQDGPASAEVAFVVHDSLQGQGIGSELLQHLAVLARAHGFETFTAMVLSDNIEMLDVFRHSGFPVRTSLNGDVTKVSMDIRPAAVTPPSPSPALG
jgi:GNAT superfamily N-acetyltransferase